MFGRVGSDDWCPTVQSVSNQHAAIWDMFLVFLSLEGGVSLPCFVSEKKRTNVFQTCCWYPFKVGVEQQPSLCLLASRS